MKTPTAWSNHEFRSPHFKSGQLRSVYATYLGIYRACFVGAFLVLWAGYALNYWMYALLIIPNGLGYLVSGYVSRIKEYIAKAPNVELVWHGFPIRKRKRAW